ncbi:MAG: leucyl aminopeptidase [Desulfotalea sp.]
MNTTKIGYEQNWQDFSGDLQVIFLDEKMVWPKEMQAIKQIYTSLADCGDFKAKKSETILYYPSPKDEGVRASRIMLVGLGGKSDDLSMDELREIGGTISQQASKGKAKNIGLYFPEIKKIKLSEAIEPIIEGILLGDYRFDKYKKVDKKKPSFSGISNVIIASKLINKACKQAVDRAEISASCGRDARDMANEPGNFWTPLHFAKYAMKLAKNSSLKCSVLERSDMKELGMGGILGVNQGSKENPKLVILEHKPKQYEKTLLVVGKGLTFDSGGISLKPGAGMEEMKYDMCGGAAAITFMKAVAKERPNIRVISIVPATDNMPGGAALKPGDIVTHFGGTTSEIINTDAEGRLILADALAYGAEKYNPDYIIDLATLTGAAIIGLGHHNTGLISNDDKLSKLVEEAGSRAGEPVWRLPLSDEYRKQIKSDVADIKNTGGRAAGTITAGAYLEKFVGDIPWVHLDIAGTAWNFTEKKYIPKGPSGTGSRTLIEFIRSF